MSDVETRLHYDHGEDKLIVQRVQDVEPILDANKREFAQAERGFSGGVMHKMASIPMVVIEQWMKEGISIFDPNCAEAIRRKLNDPANAYLRTKPGRI